MAREPRDGEIHGSDGKYIGARDVGKLRNQGLTDEQIRNNIDRLGSGNGKMVSGWAGIAKNILDAGTRDDARADAAFALGLQSEYAKDQANLNFELSQEEIERNLERFPRVSDMAQEEVGSAADFINEYMSEAFQSTMDDLVPDWRDRIIATGAEAQGDVTAVTEAFKKNVLPDAMTAADRMGVQMLGVVESQLRGEVNDDVAAQLKRRAAEVSQQIGIRGQAAKYLTARDLGLTSAQLQQAGIQNAPGAIGFGTQAYSQFAELLQAPIKSGINLTNLLSAYRAPMADVQSLYGNVLGVVSNTGLVPAGTVLGTTAQTIQGAAQIAQNTLESFYGYNAQMAMNQQAASLQSQLLREQGKQNTIQNIQTGLGLNILGGK